MTVAEYFRDAGQDTLVVLDDLTKHADAYRELALLLGRPPGREAYPGDIFYLHAQLLERATAFAEASGGGSITAFPIVETTDSDISGYIPTNLISITDGQLYLDTALFERNQRPAVDVGKSVSRVGGAAQTPSLRAAARNLRIMVARFEALESLTRVGLDVDPATQKVVERGRILRELLRQPRFTVRTVGDQLLALTALSEGWLDSLSPEHARQVVWSATERGRSQLPGNAALEQPPALSNEWREHMKALVAQAKQEQR
jgi:F-type H+-transporting ATPase subunit alpha